jgi:hypothetical protein
MGKAAENERIKLKATFLNNIAAGLFVAGVFGPFLAIIQGGLPHVYVMFNDFRSGNISQYGPLGLKALASCTAIFGAALFRHGARTEIAKLQD